MDLTSEAVKHKTTEFPGFFTSFAFFFLDIARYYLLGLIIGFLLYMTVTKCSHTPLWNQLFSSLTPLIDEPDQGRATFDGSEERLECTEDEPPFQEGTSEKRREKKGYEVDYCRNCSYTLGYLECETEERSEKDSDNPLQTTSVDNSLKCLSAMGLNWLEDCKPGSDQYSSNSDPQYRYRYSNLDRHYRYSCSNSEQCSSTTDLNEKPSKLNPKKAEEQAVLQTDGDSNCKDGGVVVVISIADKKICTADLNTCAVHVEEANAAKKDEKFLEKQTSTTELCRCFMKVLCGAEVKTHDKKLSTTEINLQPRSLNDRKVVWRDMDPEAMSHDETENMSLENKLLFSPNKNVGHAVFETCSSSSKEKLQKSNLDIHKQEEKSKPNIHGRDQKEYTFNDEIKYAQFDVTKIYGKSSFSNSSKNKKKVFKTSIDHHLSKNISEEAISNSSGSISEEEWFDSFEKQKDSSI